jgi:hypothetical protein
VRARRQRRSVIEQVARELCDGNEEGLEQVEGSRVVELLETMPLDTDGDADPDAASPEDTDDDASPSMQARRGLSACAHPLALR